MSQVISPYPLQWPDNVARTDPRRRTRSPFRTGYSAAVDNVVKSLRGFQTDSGIRIDHPVLSSNRDMMGRVLGDDPGVAAWFMFDGQWVAFAVDRFPAPEANVQAIHHIIEARRTELRYGGLAIVRQTFRSFLAIAAPGTKHWSEVLGVPRDASVEAIKAAHRRLAAERHPDVGGSEAMMVELNVARDAALRERSP